MRLDLNYSIFIMTLELLVKWQPRKERMLHFNFNSWHGPVAPPSVWRKTADINRTSRKQKHKPAWTIYIWWAPNKREIKGSQYIEKKFHCTFKLCDWRCEMLDTRLLGIRRPLYLAMYCNAFVISSLWFMIG